MGVNKMLYMRVKPDADQFVVSKNHDILIANELYTIKEFEKLRYNFMKMGRGTAALKDKFDLVDISRKQTYFFFGARFANDTGVTVPF